MQSIMVNFGQQHVETSVLSILVVLFRNPFLLAIAVVYQVFLIYSLFSCFAWKLNIKLFRTLFCRNEDLVDLPHQS